MADSRVDIKIQSKNSKKEGCRGGAMEWKEQ